MRAMTRYPCVMSTDDAAVHLLFSANRWEAAKALKTRLGAGETLVCDRYAFSGVAFTAAKGTLDLEWCKNPDRGLPAPDAVIYLDVSSVAPALCVCVCVCKCA